MCSIWNQWSMKVKLATPTSSAVLAVAATVAAIDSVPPGKSKRIWWIPRSMHGTVRGVIVRPERDSDRPRILDVVEAAFGSKEERVLVERLWASPQYRPGLSLVAE